MNNSPITAKSLGIASVILGGLTFGIQMVGELCCGWIGWPLGIAAIVCGIIAIIQGEKVLGIIGCVLSVIGVIIQILILGGVWSSIFHGLSQPPPSHH